MKTIQSLLLLCALLLLTALTACAAVPPVISYQGKLTGADAKPVADGIYAVQFAIYDVPTGGTPIWSETNTAVGVKQGLFSVLLGSARELPANVFDSPSRFFGVQVGTDPEMTPRQQIASVPFAARAEGADVAARAALSDRAILADQATTVPEGAITATRIADGAVSATKLDPGAITLGYAQVTAPQPSITVDGADLTGLQVTVTVPTGGRRVKITGCIQMYGNGNTSPFALTIREGPQILQQACSKQLDGYGTTLIVQVVLSPTAGVHTYRLNGLNDGPGSSTIYATPSVPAFILVEAI